MKTTEIALLILLLFTVVNGTIGQTEDPELIQFYRSDFKPNELNRDNYERLKETYRSYIDANGNQRGFDEEQFVFEYNYFLDRINRSGNVFYGDELSKYLNDIKDRILRANNLDVNIAVYLTDYSELNAFTNDFGNIYVNIATLAKLDSEEELTIILAHEIGHVLLKHSRRGEFYRSDIQSSLEISQEEQSFRIHSFSRDNEIEADSKAHDLLENLVGVKHYKELMYKLEYSENPPFVDEVNYSLLSSGNQSFDAYLHAQFVKTVELPEPIDIRNDSLSTHPTIKDRLEFSNKFFEEKGEDGVVFTPIRAYEEVKVLACKVLLNSYVSQGEFADALYLILSLRERHDSNWLLYKQSQVMTLFSQSKYSESPEDHIAVNLSSNDDGFRAFKQHLYAMSALDFNLLNIDFQKSQGATNEKLVGWTTYNLYANNKYLFYQDSLTNEFSLSKWNEGLMEASNTVLEIPSALRKSLDSIGVLKSIYMMPTNERLLLKSYLLDESLNDAQKEAVNTLSSIAIKQFDTASVYFGLFIHPEAAAEIFHRGKFSKANSFDPKKKSVLIQSDNLFFDSEDGYNFDFNYSKSLKLNAQLSDLSERYNSFSADYSLTSNANTSVLDNYLHKTILSWVTENIGSEELRYSRVEDEVQTFLLDEGIEYVVYRMSILNRNKGKGRKFNINYYELYFELNSGSLVYVAQIGSKQFPDRFQIEQMVYLSELNKTQGEE